MASAATHRLPPRLIRLARAAKTGRGWPALRRYSRERIAKEDRGWALLVLGYREFEAADYAPAAADLGSAVETDFPFADLATYYEAFAAYRSAEPARTVEILQLFFDKYPDSTAREDAAELLAWGYLQTAKPAEAIRLLTGLPDVNQKPELALLLGRAYQDAGRLAEAASAYQNVYYAFPATDQSRAAEKALTDLKASLGARFPEVAAPIATARAEKLVRQGDYRQAIVEYDQLLKGWKDSALAWTWNLGRAQCLLRLGKGDQAIETLAGQTPAEPEANAERLEILAEAYIQQKDESSADKVLTELETSYPRSPYCARALRVAADYDKWKPDLAAAEVLYHRLATEFPGTPQGAGGSWEAAFTEYLDGKPEAAAKDFISFIQNHSSSSRVPGAIYFLGRIAETHGKKREARRYFELIRLRYVHNYYAVQAAQRLRTLGTGGAAGHRRLEASAEDDVREIAGLIPDRVPLAIHPCDLAADQALLAPYSALHTLGLDELARVSARDFAISQTRSPEFLVNWAQLDAETGRPDLGILRTKRASPEYDLYGFDALPRKMWDLLYPRDYWSLVRRGAAAYRLDPYLVMALIRQESGFYPKAASPADARGLMQLLPDTASSRHLAWVLRRLNDPSFNIRLGCKFMRELLSRYKGNLAETLAAYNAGPGRVDDWIGKFPAQSQEEFVETIPFPGTRVYIKAIIRDAVMYRAMLSGTARYRTCGMPPKPRARLKRKVRGK